jgi:hypothetical protein
MVLQPLRHLEQRHRQLLPGLRQVTQQRSAAGVSRWRSFLCSPGQGHAVEGKDSAQGSSIRASETSSVFSEASLGAPFAAY